MDRIRAAVVGATGVVGQQFVVALEDHPWFQIISLAASERSAGRTYREALRDERTGAMRWFCSEPPPQDVLEMSVESAAELNLGQVDVIFSAVESDAAKELEPRYAEKKPVISTASAFRYFDDVPILVPGVNSEHSRLIDIQRKNRGWKGFVTTQPNCTTTGLVITLKPLQDNFGVKFLVMTSLQSLSGAGRSPGAVVLGLDILDNVIPYIVGEEEKVQRETMKILGSYGKDRIEPSKIGVTCTCTRVNVLDGHTETVNVSLERRCTVDEVKKAFSDFGKGIVGLPSAPAQMIVVQEDPFRPQPRLDRDNFDGMATSVGRIREDPVLENGVKYVLLSHNTKMGAAKGAVMIAESLRQMSYL